MMSYKRYMVRWALNAPIEELEVDREHMRGTIRWQQRVLLKFNSWKARNKMFGCANSRTFIMKGTSPLGMKLF